MREKRYIMFSGLFKILSLPAKALVEVSLNATLDGLETLINTLLPQPDTGVPTKVATESSVLMVTWIFFIQKEALRNQKV